MYVSREVRTVDGRGIEGNGIDKTAEIAVLNIYVSYRKKI